MTTSTWVPIRDSIEDAFSFVIKYIFPVVVSVAGSFALPAWAITVITKVVPALIGIVEQASPEPGTGPVKKKAVMDATEQFLALLNSTFTGGAKINFDQIRPVLSTMIDRAVTATNALAPQIIGNDPPLVGSGINAPIDSP